MTQRTHYIVIFLGGLVVIAAALACLPAGRAGWYTWRQSTAAPQVVSPTEEQPSTGALPKAGERIGDSAVSEESLGYIRRAYSQFGRTYIALDYIQWLSGLEAQQGALEDGACDALANCALGGYYVRNADPTPTIWPLSADVEIRMQTLSTTESGSYRVGEKIDLPTFVSFFDPSPKNKYQRFATVPYLVKVESGVVVRIQEKYVPPAE